MGHEAIRVMLQAFQSWGIDSVELSCEQYWNYLWHFPNYCFYEQCYESGPAYYVDGLVQDRSISISTARQIV